MSSKRFRIAFSFAGEKRDFVAAVAVILAARFDEDRILYDKFHKSEFSRSDLAFYLPDLYEKETDLVVVVFCLDYDKKEWCGLEWSAIYGLLKARKVGEVMLTRFERVEGKGLHGLAGYTDLNDLTPERAADLILERLALNEGKPKDHYKETTITDPQHWERLHPQPDVFDHLASHQQWHDLSSEVIEGFLRKARVQKQKDYLVGLKDIEQFRRFKFICDDGHVCNGACLCFGDSPSTTTPGATTKCFHWKGVAQTAGLYDDDESRQGLLQQFEAALGFLKRTLRLERQITDEGRTEVLEIPLDVLEEAVANALVHREYKARHESVVVSVYDDRIEVISPGLLPPPLHLEMIDEISTSHPRNPQIARIFYLIGYVERAGSGIGRMTSSLATRGLPPPEFEETPDKCFKVTLKRPSQATALLDAGASTTPNNLPRLQYFFGREAELKKIADALAPEARGWGALIDGPGGIGKTSVAIRAAKLISRGRFRRTIFVSAKERELTADGQRSLGSFVLPGYLEMLNAIAREMDQSDLVKSPEAERSDLLLRALREANVLLVLDNLETLPEADRDQIFAFLNRLPRGCNAIVTSRRRADASAVMVRLDRLDWNAARELIVELGNEHARLGQAAEVEQRALYEETGGNPLLIRWVAGQLSLGRSRNISAALDFLRSAPPHNNPLEFIFGDLLDTFTEDETRVLATLTHFTVPIEVTFIAELGGFSEAAAQTALGDLARRALVLPDVEERHFALVPMVADFLRRTRPEVVAETGSRLEQRAYALIIENAYQNYDCFPVLDATWPTVAPALPLFVAGPNPRLQTVCAALNDFLNFTGRWDEWLSLSHEAEASAVAANDHNNAGWRAYQAGQVCFLRQQAEEVVACADRASAFWQTAQVGARERSLAIRMRGMGHQLKADYPAAIAAYREVLDLRSSLSAESEDVAIALSALAGAEWLSGDLAAAELDYREALRVARAVGDAESLANFTGNLAGLALQRQDWLRAETLAREALPLAEKLGRQELIAADCRRLAEALVRQGKKDDARSYALRGLEIFTRLGSPSMESARQTLEQCEE